MKDTISGIAGGVLLLLILGATLVFSLPWWLPLGMLVAWGIEGEFRRLNRKIERIGRQLEHIEALAGLQLQRSGTSQDALDQLKAVFAGRA